MLENSPKREKSHLVGWLFFIIMESLCGLFGYWFAGYHFIGVIPFLFFGPFIIDTILSLARRQEFKRWRRFF